MVNFRFHLVSLTAVFFALALGVTVGATVLERTTVDTLESQVNRVEARLDETDRLNEQLRGELQLRDSFGEQIGDRLLEGDLVGIPIALISVEGVDPTAVDALRSTLAAAGADVDTVVAFTAKLALAEEDHARELAELMELTATRPDLLRRQLFAALSTSWTSGTAHDLLVLLSDAGFAQYDQALEGTEELEVALPRRFVVVSDDAAEVPNDDLGVPFTEELARDGEHLVLAAEAGEVNGDGSFSADFVSALRTRESVAGVIATVDNVGTFIGRTAAVMALVDLGAGRLGHYGRGDGAETLVPPSPTS